MSHKTQWETLHSKAVYESERTKIRHDVFRRHDGTEDTYEVIDRKTFTIVIPILNNKLILVEQYRYPVTSRSLEFPAGTSTIDEDLYECAKRELEEETGLIARSLEFLGTLWVGPGGSSQYFNVYIAQNLLKGTQKLDETEADLEVKEYTIEEVKSLIKKNIIKDSNTVAAFGLYLSSNV